LRRNGVVKSTRGPGGGYTLNHDASDISVSDVILAVDESCQVAGCDDSESCSGDYQCLTHDLWNELSNEIRSFLDGISLAEMMANEKVQQVSLRQDKVSVNAA
jgi:Rrf2 family iron-sulfur cluster assembly transcriptional regulator